MTSEVELSKSLYQIGAVRFGEFTLKDGRLSPFYLDLRILVSSPNVLASVGRALVRRADRIPHDRLAGLPYAGLPIAVAMCLIGGRPLIYPRREAKHYGTGKRIEGEFRAGERILVVDDVITTGGAKLEAIAALRAAGLEVEDVLVVIDREDRGAAVLAEAGLHLHSVIGVQALLDHLREADLVSEADVRRALDFLSPKTHDRRLKTGDRGAEQ